MVWLWVVGLAFYWGHFWPGLSCPLVGALVVEDGQLNEAPLGCIMVHQVAKTVALATILDLKSCLWVAAGGLKHVSLHHTITF